VGLERSIYAYIIRAISQTWVAQVNTMCSLYGAERTSSPKGESTYVFIKGELSKSTHCKSFASTRERH
jgi:hypothetical protein